jgi:hypothetical protein
MMNNLHEVKLNLSDAQLKKLMKTNTVQLSNADIGVGKSFQVSKKVNTKINRAIRQNKGLRISGLDLRLNEQDEIEGGDILKKLGIKKAVNKTFTEKNMKRIGLQGAKMVAQSALPAVAEAVNAGVSAYAGPLAGMAAKSAINEFGEMGIRQIPSGNGLRLKKGSAEAKAYMASIRANKSGGSFRPNGKSGGSFRPNGGAVMNESLLDGHYAVLPNSNMFNGINTVNGNPLLKQMKSTQSLYNDAPRIMPKKGRGLNGKVVI